MFHARAERYVGLGAEGDWWDPRTWVSAVQTVGLEAGQATRAKIPQYWAEIKDRLATYARLDTDVGAAKREAAALVQMASQKGDTKTVIAASQAWQELTAAEPTAKSVAAKVRQYHTQWASATESAVDRESGLGALPLVLGAAALIALAYVAANGAKTYATYLTQRRILDDLKAKSMTAAQAQELMKAASGGGPLFGFSLGGMDMTPILLVGAAAIGFVMWKGKGKGRTA